MCAVAKMFSGARLRRLRNERVRLTQAALAQALDLSTSYVNQLENDQRPHRRASADRAHRALRPTRS